MTFLRSARPVSRLLSIAMLLSCFPLVLLLAGCGSKMNASSSSAPTNVTPASGAPPSVTISANPATLAPGGSSTLSVTASNATQVTIKGSDSSSYTLQPTGGTQAVTPAATTTYTAVATGASGNVSAATTVTVTAVAMPTVAISAAPASISVGGSSVLQVTASNATQVTVTGTDGSSYTIPPTGGTQTVTPTATTTYTALAAAAGSATATASATVTLVAKTLTSIAVTPATPGIAVGATQQLTATATYNDGTTANVTATTSWAAANATVATVNAAGLVTGTGGGSTSIVASLNGIIGTDTITVAAAQKTVTSIAVTPPTVSFSAGSSQQLTATATYSDGSTANVTSTVAWTAANASVATVNSAGLATGVGSGSTSVSATLGGISGSDMLAVAAGAKTVSSIAITPANAGVAMNSAVQLSATATYSDNSTADVTSAATWTAAHITVATVSTDGLVTGVASGSTTISAALSGVSGTDSVTVNMAAGSGVNIATWHADNNRSGLNADEQSLTPANVTPATFGKLFSYVVDGYVYGEPLLMSNITVNGGVHNVVYAATENDSVYAFDADSYGNGTPLWQVSLLQSGETPLTTAPIQPVQGVTSTPVIDTATNTMYVVSAQKSASGSIFRLNALDITTGAQKFGGPMTINASVAGTNSSGNGSLVTLTTACAQRAALLLANGTVYIGVGGCPTGWLLAYNAQTLAQIAVFNSSPNLNGEGKYASAGGIWMGSGGPVADSQGNIYVVTGNGPWDGQTAWGDSVLKFNAKLQMLDYFTPDDYAYAFCQDADLSAGGLLLIPGTTQALAGGKTGRLYLTNTANLGHEQAADAGATQSLWFESDLVTPYAASCTDSGGTHPDTVNSYENFGTGAYFNGAVYLGVTPTAANVPAGVRQFLYSGTLTPSVNTTPSIQQGSYGTTPFISANGTANGILWMVDHGLPLQNNHANPTNATLRAYDISNLADETYNSGTNSADTPGFGIKFTSPVVGNGKVYISTGHDQVTTPNPKGELDVYGLK